MPVAPSAAEQYLADLRAIRNTGSATPETSFYPAVEKLFNAAGQALTPPVLFSTQLRNQGAGMPDGGFFPQPGRSRRNPGPPLLQNPERGVVEIKGADQNLDALVEEVQTKRYLRQYGVVLLTNLREFRLLEHNPAGAPRLRERYVLANSADDLWYRTNGARHNQLLPDFLQRVMLYRVPLAEPKQVAWLLASYAREARARAEEHDLPSFQNVKLALEESLGIKFEGEKGEHFFRSTLVQTLFYGIFSAWVLWRHSPEGRGRDAWFNWKLSDDFLRVPILRKLFREVSDRAHLNTIQLTEILDLAGEALNRVRSTLFDVFQGAEAVAYFYEPFLEAFDPVLRKELGVWYTPREIVRYMVERVDHLLRTELNQPLGLASPVVRILDPCCGTGAYLTAVLDRIHRTLHEAAGDDTALVPAELRKAALERVFGFEIMPAPFVIAHMEVARLLEDAGAPLHGRQRAGVYLTNALTGWEPEVHPQSVLSEEFRREREDSEHIKQQGTILVILGNPPYNGYAGIATIKEERGLTTAYRAPVAGLPAPQGQGLNDLYIRFFRIAERRIAGNPDDQGIVCFISNYSWLDGLSHTTMRHHYANTFSTIYVDNLHGDRKISEYAPDGRTSETAFAMPGSSAGIRLGTSVTTLVRTTSQSSGAAIRYRDFDAARAADRREAMLDSLNSGSPAYRSLMPDPELGLPFKPRVVGSGYFEWPRLPELFPVSFPGVKTSRDALVVDIDRERLETRLKQYLNVKLTDLEIANLIPCAMQPAARFNPSTTRKALLAHGPSPIDESSCDFRPWQVLRYAYRPFDVRWLYWEPRTKLLDEKRAEFVGQLISHTVWIEARQRESGESFCRGCIATGLADNFGNGLSSFFPAIVVESAGALLEAVEVRPNLTSGAESYLSQTGAKTDDLFFHALAVMHTPAYRRENAGALLSDWPRIPLPATAALLSGSAALGRRLAELLDAELELHLAGEWSFLGALKIPQYAELEKALEITAGWGSRGQGGTTMPGKGRLERRAWTGAEREKLATLEASQELTLEAAYALLGEECVDVSLNGEVFWAAVPLRVWEYTLGGYQVLKKWLSYREAALLGRPLRHEEAAYFSQVVRRITAILLMGPRLDASYRAILPEATGLGRQR